MAIQPGGRKAPKIGPSDSSDTYSDNPEAVTDSDAGGTGERGPASDRSARERRNETSPDRVVDSRDAGLGGGLDQAEEARLGITDEEIEKDRERSIDKRPPPTD